MEKVPDRWDLLADVVVMGSGAAAFAAAISAADAGARVVMLERSDKIGGTSAVSGGVVWMPNNHRMHEIGATDSREEALTYLRRLSLGRAEEALLETFIDTGPTAIRHLEEGTAVRFRVLKYPDYHPEFPGAKHGRSLDPELFDGNQLGEWVQWLRQSPHNPAPITVFDLEAGMDVLDFNLIAERMQKGLRAGGNALIGGLLKGALDRKIEIRRQVRGRRLFTRGGEVIGLAAEEAGREIRIGARRGVVLASGGFEWNQKLCTEFLRGPLEGSSSPPVNEGDGLLMAMEVGAQLGNMTETWWMPMLRIPGEEYEGRDFYRLTLRERTMPGSIIVNRAGRRFVNEAHNYNDIGRAFHVFDPVRFEFPNIPAWLIFDHGYKSRYPIMTVFPDDPIPTWMAPADSLRDLALREGIDPEGLQEAVRRFNESAARGQDADFHRGESIYDHYNGDQSRQGALTTLGPLETPPFYALRVYSGTLGTKGGPKTNQFAQVLNVWGEVIRGLYAAGNAAAGITGMAYGGAGGTIGPGLTFGYIAGRGAAAESNRI